MNRKNEVSSEYGFTLIEVMVAVLILAVGLFGVSSMTSRSMSYNQNAYFASMASALGYDMLDRIKANTTYSVGGSGYIVSLGSTPLSYSVTCEGVGADCSPSQMAAYDIGQWKFLLNEHLPDGDGTIVITNRPGGRRTYTITIFYDGSKKVRARRQIIVEAEL